MISRPTESVADFLLELVTVEELYEIRIEHAACVAVKIRKHIGKVLAGAVGTSDGIGCRIETIGAGEDLVELIEDGK